MALLLKHQTVSEFVTRMRAAYRDGDAARVLRVAKFIIGRIQAGDITDAQCRNAFGLTVNQWNNLKVKMNNLIDADIIVRSAVGE